MKCPKCGYTSFETNDSCRKCANDLSAFRAAYGLTPIVLPATVRTEMVAALGGAMSEQHPAQDAGGDLFSFDLPQHEEPAATAVAGAAPFAFGALPSAGNGGALSAPSATASNDPFADLLETSSTASNAAPSPLPTASPSATGQGFELNSFSWDDTPEPPSPGAEPSKPAPAKVDDDFSSLFGDLGSPDKKP